MLMPTDHGLGMLDTKMSMAGMAKVDITELRALDSRHIDFMMKGLGLYESFEAVSMVRAAPQIPMPLHNHCKINNISEGPIRVQTLYITKSLEDIGQ